MMFSIKTSRPRLPAEAPPGVQVLSARLERGLSSPQQSANDQRLLFFRRGTEIERCCRLESPRSSPEHVRRYCLSAATASRAHSAFTLIEIMVVIAIMAIIMGMTVPFAYKALKKEGMGQAVSEVVEVCSHARARAIMGGEPTF